MKETIIKDELMINRKKNLLYYKKNGNWIKKDFLEFKEIHFSNSESLINQTSTIGKIVFSSFPCKGEGYIVVEINDCYYLYKVIKENKVKYVQLLCEKFFPLPCSNEIKDVSNVGVNGFCIVPGKEGETTYVLNRFIPGFSEIFDSTFPPCGRQICYTNVIYVPQQYSDLQAAINYVANNGPNNTTIIVDKNYIYEGPNTLTISASSATNKLNGLSLVSCGATIYCAPYYNGIPQQYAGIYINGPLTDIKIVGFNIINGNHIEPTTGSFLYGILATGGTSTSIVLLSLSIKNNNINLNTSPNSFGIFFTDIALGPTFTYLAVAEIENNNIENFTSMGIGILPSTIFQSALLSIVCNTIKSSFLMAYGINVSASYIYVCGNKIITTNSIFLQLTKTIIANNTLISSPTSSNSIGISCTQVEASATIYKNFIKEFYKGINFALNTLGNLVSNNVFDSNTIDISDIAGPFPGGGVNVSICNRCSDGKCNGCVTTKLA